MSEIDLTNAKNADNPPAYGDLSVVDDSAPKPPPNALPSPRWKGAISVCVFSMTSVLFVAMVAATYLMVSCPLIWLLAIKCFWPLWLAIPVGLVLGLAFVSIFHHANGCSTLMEFGISNGILFVLLVLLYWSFGTARHKSHRHRSAPPPLLAKAGPSETPA